MRDPRVVVFCEDRGHEVVVGELCRRVGAELGVPLDLTTPVARGGFGNVTSELRAFQRGLQSGAVASGVPDVLVVAADTNCKGRERRDEVASLVDGAVVPRSVLACPDPHVEKWLMADPSSFRDVVGLAPPSLPQKCERSRYKHALADVVSRSGTLLLLGDPLELAPDIVARMDLRRAASTDDSLGSFLDDLRRELRRLGSERH